MIKKDTEKDRIVKDKFSSRKKPISNEIIKKPTKEEKREKINEKWKDELQWKIIENTRMNF